MAPMVPPQFLAKRDLGDQTEDRFSPTERQRLWAHRTLGLIDLGFSLEQALVLRRRNDVVHEAQALLERGWPREFVAEELSTERSNT